MPIFQADLEHREDHHGGDTSYLVQSDSSYPSKPTSTAEPSSPPITIHRHRRRLSEDSIRTELCEGPVPDSPRPRTPEIGLNAVSDRAELIERLKRGAAPAWIPDSLAQPPLDSLLSCTRPAESQEAPGHGSKSPSLLPSAQITPEKTERTGAEEQRLREGLSIERPRSALHSGDFTHHSHDHAHDHDQPSQPRQPFPKERDAISSLQAHHTWAATSPPRPSGPLLYAGGHVPQTSRPDPFAASIPSSLSSSFSSSFVYKPPTSPLVQSETNDDLEAPLRTRGIDIGFSTPAAPRRPQSLYATASPTPFAFTSAGMSPQRTPSFRREATFPYQAHQPRRSLTSTPSTNLYTSAPGTPAFMRSRRPSFSSDSSPLHHASMVGSYEESILRGRMSTTPSKPLDFLAQIGVLGMGKCKASLRCPPHVTLPFPAVFYSYNSAAVSGRPGVEDGPSPYVGQIDLENGLGNPEEERRSRKKMQSRYADRKAREGSIVGGSDEASRSRLPEEDPPRRPPMSRRRSGSPKAPPGGSYRIPEKGRIQIVIKNQHKTAVKLFLVPYDLTGMEPGTKTFIRQRSYSAGPIIDGLPPPRTLGKEAGSNSNVDDERPVLRYLVHLHICCPSKGRFYLYRNVRVVFANRVPDGKAKLRNETTWPEPRFSPYKPVRAMHPPVTAATRSGAMLAAEKAFRRRSAGFTLGGFAGASVFAPDEGLGTWQAWPHPGFSGHGIFSPATSSAALDFTDAGDRAAGDRAGGELIDAVPLVRLPSRGRIDSGEGWSTNATGAIGIQSPGPRNSSREVGGEEEEGQKRAVGISLYEKLSKGDVGYGGNAFASGVGQGTPPEEGLLSQRLRSLGVRAGQFTEGTGFNDAGGPSQP